MLIIDQNPPVAAQFRKLARHQRMVFLAGIPGVGKSLLVQQLLLLAQQSGRRVHLFQWDVSRISFETDRVIAKYPEVDGVTHAAIRKAVGLWARQAVFDWHQAHPDPADMLIGELPLVGNRLIEMVQIHNDEVEALLTAGNSSFILPIPSNNVRAHIEKARAQSIAQPRNAREVKDAEPQVLSWMWQEMVEVASLLDLVPQDSDPKAAYDAEIYDRLFSHLLQHRNMINCRIDQPFDVNQSVYDGMSDVVSELVASDGEVEQAIQIVEDRYQLQELQSAVSNWYRL